MKADDRLVEEVADSEGEAAPLPFDVTPPEFQNEALGETQGADALLKKMRRAISAVVTLQQELDVVRDELRRETDEAKDVHLKLDEGNNCANGAVTSLQNLLLQVDAKEVNISQTLLEATWLDIGKLKAQLLLELRQETEQLSGLLVAEYNTRMQGVDALVNRVGELEEFLERLRHEAQASCQRVSAQASAVSARLQAVDDVVGQLDDETASLTERIACAENTATQLKEEVVMLTPDEEKAAVELKAERDRERRGKVIGAVLATFFGLALAVAGAFLLVKPRSGAEESGTVGGSPAEEVAAGESRIQGPGAAEKRKCVFLIPLSGGRTYCVNP